MEFSENISSELKLTPIQEFYSGANIFITGATGFLGQILIEKLLRSCPTISKIYLLLRPKKNKDMNTRLHELFGTVIFSKLRRLNPKFNEKIVPIAGDCSLPNLGLSATDINVLINNVSIVFHVAATVRFDEPIEVATKINVKAVRDLAKLVREFKGLKAFIHVSTAYSNCPNHSIEEKVYEPPISGEKLIELTETTSSQSLKDLTPSLIGKWPNTYAFTKCVAEDILKRETIGLPVGIFRPAIVISTVNEPLQAWINNFYGPSGFVTGTGMGLMRILHMDVDKDACLVPVDMCINSMIASAWEVNIEHKKAENEKRSSQIAVYNYVSTNDKPITWGRFVMTAFKRGKELIPITALWWPSIRMVTNFWLYFTGVIFLHFLPAVIADGILLCMRKKPKMIKAYKKIYTFCNAVSYFTTQEWKFKSDRVRNLIDRMSVEDKTMFFSDMRLLNWEEYIHTYITGIRVYMLHDPVETVPEAQARVRKFYYAHQILKILFYGLLLKLFYFVIFT